MRQRAIFNIICTELYFYPADKLVFLQRIVLGRSRPEEQGTDEGPDTNREPGSIRMPDGHRKKTCALSSCFYVIATFVLVSHWLLLRTCSKRR